MRNRNETFETTFGSFELQPGLWVDLALVFELEEEEMDTDVAPGHPMTLTLESATDEDGKEWYDALTDAQVVALQQHGEAVLNELEEE